jgi:hypothetical protein
MWRRGPMGAVDVDSLGSTRWRGYLRSDALRAAWRPTPGSPYLRFVRDRSVDFVGDLLQTLGDALRPRNTYAEMNAEDVLRTMTLRDMRVDARTAVILDSGGAHSVAMGARLVLAGWQPVLLLNAPADRWAGGELQNVAALLFNAARLDGMRAAGTFPSSTAPPVFVLDAHRDGGPGAYQIAQSDLPTGSYLRLLGMRRALYVNEADRRGIPDPGTLLGDADMTAITRSWADAGVEVMSTGIAPWAGFIDHILAGGLPAIAPLPSPAAEEPGDLGPTQRERTDDDDLGL